MKIVEKCWIFGRYFERFLTNCPSQTKKQADLVRSTRDAGTGSLSQMGQGTCPLVCNMQYCYMVMINANTRVTNVILE